MTVYSANTFNFNISDTEMRLTFLDCRPMIRLDGQALPPIMPTAEIVAEVVLALSLAKQMVDMLNKHLDQHALGKEGRVDN